MRKKDLTILIVDDEPDDQFVIERALRKIGATGPIHIANDGEEAIAYLKGEGQFSDRQKFQYPSFLITDLKMPVADGFEVLDYLKSDPTRQIIPTVVLSTSSDADDIQKSYRLDASSFHTKPARYEDLCDLLRSLYDYWLRCEVPEIDETGAQMVTHSEGKLGQRFSIHIK